MYTPSHPFAVNWNPLEQEHKNDPGVFWQVASAWQGLRAHSSISKEMKDIDSFCTIIVLKNALLKVY